MQFLSAVWDLVASAALAFWVTIEDYPLVTALSFVFVGFVLHQRGYVTFRRDGRFRLTDYSGIEKLAIVLGILAAVLLALFFGWMLNWAVWFIKILSIGNEAEIRPPFAHPIVYLSFLVGTDGNRWPLLPGAEVQGATDRLSRPGGRVLRHRADPCRHDIVQRMAGDERVE